MGIDVYMRWTGQTDEERQAQYTGFSIVHGRVGYLREAYHGDPYATRVLVPEAFSAAETDQQEVPIPAAVLRERLPAALDACEIRHTTLYQDSPDLIARAKQSYIDFVALAERKEETTGEPVRILVSA
jgi:hypothetical protein